MNRPVPPDCYTSIFKNAPDALLLVDGQGQVQRMNTAAQILFRAEFSALENLSLEALIKLWEETPLSEQFVRLRSEKSSRNVTAFIPSDDDERVDCEWTSACFEDQSGNLWFLLSFRDVSNTMSAYRAALEAATLASELASHDFLTGLLNRRGFMEFLEHELDRAKRTGTHTGLVMMDLDYFKQVNDQYGHACGDWLLQEVSALMTASLREYDILARFAGDEFIMLLPETTQSEALIIAERLRHIIELKSFEQNNIRLKITTSLGVISVQANFDAPAESLISAVDKALYLAKASRNSVYCLDVEMT
ncbi:sensor domain-containing diguanylate cyclase [Acidaminobacter hydrogenoformans]|uniref:sensor domain-containing diguanylate cyclase n=1 Tax=Acidaminobacter hydrogenoformans TaxID=65403 RepID=UPI000B83935A|nr:sensor domain-containing diguanylate cyclase [Acidaminobacter hydrogenoformans]